MTKKSFIDDVAKDYNPAEAFISTPAQTPTKPPLEDRETIEAKLQAERERRNKPRLDKRLNLLLTQALYDDLTALSRFDGKSVNSIINEALTELTTARKGDIEKIRSL
jgi:hypothetical protein